MNIYVRAVMGLVTLIGMVFGVQHVNFGSFNPVGGSTYLLQAGVSASQSTITLTSFTEPSSGIKYTMAYINSDIVYGTLAPSTGNSEFVSFTGISQNANGTATLSGVTRGLSRTPGTTGCTASTTLAHAYPGQTQFILSDSPCFYGEYAVKKNDEAIRGSWTFYSTSTPHYFYNPSTLSWTSLASTTLASKGYVDDQVTAGCANANTTTRGCVEIATALEAASSTQIGGTGAILVYGNGMATDTPAQSSLSGTKIVMSAIGGYLAQGWINLGQTFTWTALHTFTGGVTSTGTTTVSASSLVTNPLVLNGLVYQWPAARAASSTILSEDGTGKVSWEQPFDKVLFNNGNIAKTNTGTGTTTGATIAIPANSLTTGTALRVHATLYSYGSSGTCYPDIRYGTGVATTSYGPYVACGRDGFQCTVDGTFYATSTASQYGLMEGNSFSTQSKYGAFTPYSLTATSYIDVTMRGDTAGNSCDLDAVTVELLRQ